MDGPLLCLARRLMERRTTVRRYGNDSGKQQRIMRIVYHTTQRRVPPVWQGALSLSVRAEGETFTASQRALLAK